MKKKSSCKIVIYFAIIFCIISIFSNSVTVYAADDREALRDELNDQEETLEDKMDSINPLDSENTQKAYNSAINVVEEQKKKEASLNVSGKVEQIKDAIFKIVVKTRTSAIISYALTWIIGIIYAATMGSRDVNKRRKVYLIIRNTTVLFFVYINIPLFIIWLNTDLSQITQITMFNLMYDLIEFLQVNSLIIGCLLAYAGRSRLIISRKDLPVRKQGIYLIKFAVISVIFLNIVPFAMYFII